MIQFKIIFVLFFAIFKIQAQTSIYTSQNFLLQLDGYNNFTFYPKETSLDLTISGEIISRNDSLILTTHKVNNETAIFAILSLHSNHLTSLFKQKEFYKSIPDVFYLLKKIHKNGSIAQENYWKNFENGIYEKYEFDENKNILARQNYKNFVLHQKQLIFKGDKESTISFELNYKNGKLHRKSYYYKKLETKIPQVQLVKIEKYRKGKLRKTKKPAKQRVFYTTHF